ncbi:MAG: UDP-forming cellulose synthase catalytic subunit [Leptolyngbyaceae cyanobacterium HOT.MB2.61]|jgi:cellulose synthase (UDP-forming)|nr:UDP-forming cellulose synthase catalytic subunit [Leptolyngbyaceae cyanobacterium HOT.MB2.61]
MNGLYLNYDRFSTWLVNGLPSQFDILLRGLGRRHLVILMGALMWLFTPLVTTRLPIWQQGILAGILIAIGLVLVRTEERQNNSRVSEYVHLLLMMLSLIATIRYLYYRTCYTLNFDSWLDSIFCLLLYVAELYAILTLGLSYFQTLKIKERKPVDLSTIPEEQWFSVDVYIPTYNEEVEIVRKTALGALAIDYPADKKQVYILDDGRAEKYRERREALRQMCEELGCILITRDNNDHAKAGNINNALKQTHGDLVLILDCDHIPARSFLQDTVGFFLNSQVALVQTPHWFYNPDPFERNLLTSGRVPVGNELFYKVLQKGNDFWNAAFFCGSAAVIRRDYVLGIGGIATETVTEDCHTSLRLHSLGYETIYYDKIMVAGLAPEKFSSYIGQQVRWARGMAQILRLENPLFNRKLNLRLAQRLCYFSATSHFFFGFPRLMYLMAPMLFLLLGINSVKGLGLETLFYALPHIALSMQTNHIPYKHVRFSFWNEIYEFALSFQAGIVTLLALINPRLGKFNVTDKGLSVTRRSFDLDSVRYLLILGVLSAASLLVVPFWLLLSPQDTQAVLINALWCMFNLFLVVAACLVAFEQPQLRQSHRLPRQITAIIHSDNQSWIGKTRNVSETGAQILLDVWPNIPDEVRVELVGDFGARALMDARILRGVATSQLQTLLSVQFINPSRTQMDDLIVVLYSDVKEWYSQKRSEKDNPLQSFQFIMTSLVRVFKEFQPEVGVKVRKQVRSPVQLHWEGWETLVFQATVTELGSRDLRLELEDHPDLKLDELQQTKPLIGLLFTGEKDFAPQSLLAQVQTVSIIASPSLVSKDNLFFSRVVMELSFPESLDKQQKGKIRKLLRAIAEQPATV